MSSNQNNQQEASVNAGTQNNEIESFENSVIQSIVQTPRLKEKIAGVLGQEKHDQVIGRLDTIAELLQKILLAIVSNGNNTVNSAIQTLADNTQKIANTVESAATAVVSQSLPEPPEPEGLTDNEIDMHNNDELAQKAETEISADNQIEIDMEESAKPEYQKYVVLTYAEKKYLLYTVSGAMYYTDSDELTADLNDLGNFVRTQENNFGVTAHSISWDTFDFADSGADSQLMSSLIHVTKTKFEEIVYNDLKAMQKTATAPTPEISAQSEESTVKHYITVEIERYIGADKKPRTERYYLKYPIIPDKVDSEESRLSAELKEQLRLNGQKADFIEFSIGHVQVENIEEITTKEPYVEIDSDGRLMHVFSEAIKAKVDKLKEEEKEKYNPLNYNDISLKLPIGVLNNVVSSSMTLIDELTVDITNDGLTARFMDPSHIAMVDISLPQSAFEVFEIADQALKLAFRVDDLQKKLKTFGKNDRVTIQSKFDEGFLELRSDSGQKATIRLMEVSSGSTPLPKLNFNTKVGIDNKCFDSVLKGIKTTGEYITIESIQQTRSVKFKTHGDSGEFETEKFTHNAEELTELEVKEDSKATYSLDYIEKIYKAGIKSLKNPVEFEYSSKMPLRITYRPDVSGSKIEFYLAPRVQD